MDEFLQKYTKALLIIPPSIFTFIMCVTFGWFHIGLFLFYVLAWSIISIFLWLIYILFDSITRSIKRSLIARSDTKKMEYRIITCLKLNQQQWKDFSNEEKRSYFDLYLKQAEIKQDLVNVKINKLPYQQINTKDKWEFEKKKIKEEIEKEWNKYSLDVIIRIINKAEQKKVKQEQINQARLKQELKLAAEQKLKEDLINLKKQKDEESEKRTRAERLEIESKKKQEENNRIQEIRNQELLEKIKKENNKRYKEKQKREILEKERKRRLRSEAIQELINNGELSNNYSHQHKREHIPSEIRQYVWERDLASCVICKSQEKLEYDHIIPVSKGGSSTINNIQILCQKCNRAKSNNIL